MKKILIGTHNKGKYKEIAFLLSKRIVRISPQALKIKSPKETGKTFKENAELKVNYFSKSSGLPVISDDSGLSIHFFKGKPGINSARWAKRYGGFQNAMKIILKKMNKVKKRTAVFTCCLSFKLPGKKIITVTGKIKGKISERIIGTKGFGYDPIFIPQSKNITYGQMSWKKKIRIDHRFIAFKKLKKKIKTL